MVEQRYAVEINAAGVGIEATDETVQQGRLTRAVRSDDRVHGAGLDLEIDFVQGLEATELFVYVFNGKK